VARVAPEPADLAYLDRATAEVLAEFESAGVGVLLLKGAALRALLYTAGEHRSYSDIDLLVAPSDIRAAEEALGALGYANATSVVGVDDVGGVVHADTWVRQASTSPTMIDLHRWLSGAETPSEVAWPALLRHRTWIDVAGRRAAVLDSAGQAMHLALHTAQHGAAYDRQLDELALALERWPADVWDSAAALAAEIGATRPFAAGLRLLSRGAAEAARLELPATHEEDWAIRHRAARPRGMFHVRALAEASSVSERLRILRRALLPNRAWIVHQHPRAERSTLALIGAYAAHLARAPAWAARAWLFRWRTKRNARRR
jgi:hypothetical protein